MDPYNQYDENPDHIVAGKAVEGACWMSGGAKDYPEYYKAGLKPSSVREKILLTIAARTPPDEPHRGHQLIYRHKVKGNVANKGKGPAGEAGSRLTP